jgi:hypothetical protein
MARVLSPTAELRDFPKAKSYVAEVERAISAAGHVIADMSDFPAANQPAAEICVERVRGCDVYVGVLGTRYGSPVRDLPGVSYTELEFNTATEAKKDRLILMLDTNADDVGIPASQLIDREFGDRQDAFRGRVMESGLVKQSFDSPPGWGGWWNARCGSWPRPGDALRAGCSVNRSRRRRSRCGPRSLSTCRRLPRPRHTSS